MKTEEEIIEKLKELYKKKLKERRGEYLKTSHLNCKYNSRHRVKDFGLVGFCNNPNKTNNGDAQLYVVQVKLQVNVLIIIANTLLRALRMISIKS